MSSIVDLRKKTRLQPAVPAPSHPQRLAPADNTGSSFVPLEWEALEFPEASVKNRDSLIRWALIAGIPVVLLLFFLKNILGAIVVVLAAFTLVFEFSRKPRLLHIAITSQGVTVNQKQYPYKELSSFWITTNHEKQQELSMRKKRAFALPLTMPLGDTNADDIREALGQFLPEEEQQSSPQLRK